MTLSRKYNRLHTTRSQSRYTKTSHKVQYRKFSISLQTYASNTAMWIGLRKLINQKVNQTIWYYKDGIRVITLLWTIYLLESLESSVNGLILWLLKTFDHHANLFFLASYILTDIQNSFNSIWPFPMAKICTNAYKFIQSAQNFAKCGHAVLEYLAVRYYLYLHLHTPIQSGVLLEPISIIVFRSKCHSSKSLGSGVWLLKIFEKNLGQLNDESKTGLFFREKLKFEFHKPLWVAC